MYCLAQAAAARSLPDADPTRPAGRHVTVARATIYALTPAAVTISLRKPLRRGLLLPCEMSNGTPTMQPPPNLAPAGPAAAQQAHHVQQQQQATAAGGPAPMEVDGLAPAGDAAAGAPAAPGASAAFDPAVRWRLDRDDVSSTFVKLRANVFSLFRPEDERAARLRHLVVGLAPPEAALQVGWVIIGWEDGRVARECEGVLAEN